MKKTVDKLKITAKKQLNYDNYLIQLKSSVGIETIKAGQFVNVLIEDKPSTFLRRPFSIHDIIPETNEFQLIVKEVGDGSKSICSKTVGDTLDVVYPLGNGFTIPQNPGRILLIGGGVGVAPMMQTARVLKESGCEVHILFGARSEKDHYLLNEFAEHGKVYITTNDGTLGEEGFVTDHSVLKNPGYFDSIYCCVPEPMMQAVAKVAQNHDVNCEVSLENLMACGYGVCLCCVTPTSDGNKCVCTEGPVFNIKELKW